MRRMKIRVTTALQQFRVPPWEERIEVVRKKYEVRLSLMPNARWEKLSLQWQPAELDDPSQEYRAYRRRGRPLLRWRDHY